VSAPGFLGSLIQDLLLIWGAGRPEDFRDQIVYLPVGR
jgi:hypothetical protein